MQNIKIICRDCGNEFNFSVKEQKFFEEKGYPQPVRCKDCRKAKKERNEVKQKNDFEDLLQKFIANTVKIKK